MRVRGADAFRTTLRRGRRAASQCCELIWQQGPLPHRRLGLIVGRHAGNAVLRNRFKRRVRDWFRHQAIALPAGDWLVRARPGGGSVTIEVLREDLTRMVQSVTRRRR